MKKQVTSIFLIFCLSFLAACGNTANTENTQHNTKQEFILQTKNLSDFGGNFSREYTTVIDANSSLQIPAESAGKVSSIRFKEGQTVRAGATIISLEDTMTNYDLAVKQAQNAITLQDASAQTSLVNIDNQISAAEAQYNKALVAYNQLMEQTNLKYDNVVQENKNKLKTFNDTYKSQLNNIEAMMNQQLFDADKILGMTSENQYINTAFKAYLGIANGVGISKSTDSWNKLYGVRGEMRKRMENNTPFTESDTAADMALLEKWYTAMRTFVADMIEMLQNNVHGAGLSPEMTNGWLSQWNGHRNSIQSAESGFINWKTQTNSFLDTYKNNEIATKIAVETQNRPLTPEELADLQKNSELNLAYQNADLSVASNIENARLAMEQAKTSFENIKTLRDATEKQLAASRQNAELSLVQAQRNASRLAVKAPINGTITKIHAEVGQTVNNGTIIVDFAGSQAQSVVEVDPRMALTLSVGESVETRIGEKKLSGKISAISSIPGANMLSTVRIAYDDAKNFIGQPATIVFETKEILEKNSYLLPVNSVTIVEEGLGKIQIFKDNTIVTENVRLGAMYGKNIEIFTDIANTSTIILNDTSRYNPENFTLKTQTATTNE